MLHKSWHGPGADPVALSAQEFDSVTTLLYESGAAGLGWWRIRETDLRQTPSGEMLHQAFRLLALQAAMHESRIQKVFGVLRSANVEPILIKGWAVARAYPNPALRPYGDIDLMVRSCDFERATDVLAREARDCLVDLHRLPFELADRSIEELFSRSELVSCGVEHVRVLSPEDHFALLAVHLLKHGAWRPLWLCDLGVLLESMSDGFDWDLCLGKDPRRQNWILAATGLAQTLLNASTNDNDIAARAERVPLWLKQEVLKQWETPFAAMQSPFIHPVPISFNLRSPRGFLRDLARRWPNPIMATISVKGTFGARHRKRYEFGNWLLRAARVVSARFRPRNSFAETP